jgi:hypothetical protein
MLRVVLDWLASVRMLAAHAMGSPFRRELGLIVGWLIFPLVPVVLEDAYYQICALNVDSRARFGPDPRDWGWGLWFMMLGPLLGYGFLAGATVDLPDAVEPTSRWWRRLAARRSLWVAVGPWWSSLLLFAGILAYGYLLSLFPVGQNPAPPAPEPGKGTWGEPVMEWVSWALGWVLVAIFGVAWSCGWLWPAWAALRRAARTGRMRRALYRGLSVAVAFVGSLFGSFWAATSFWRTYFFDSTVAPLIVMAIGLAFTSGCAPTITYGELRRRELFHAMLVAWVLGLALMWRWWSRRRPPPTGA